MDNSNVFSWHFMFCLHWIAAHSITRLLFVAVIDFCCYDFSPCLSLPLACWSCIHCKCVCIFLISNSIGDLIMSFVVFFSIPFPCIASMTTTKHDNKMQQSTSAKSEKFIVPFESFIISHSFTFQYKHNFSLCWIQVWMQSTFTLYMAGSSHKAPSTRSDATEVSVDLLYQS